MADDNPDNVLSATFPAPPPFWKHFTPNNRTRFKELQQQYAADHPAEDASASDALPPRIPDVPPELRYLQPPEPPANGKYRNFGDAYDINTALTSLRSMGVEQLYPSPPSSPSPEQQADQGGDSGSRQQVIHSQWTLDRAAYIKKMTQSLMLNYLEMLGVLSVDPARWQEKYEHMQTLLFNAHHLINEYRPHQARASLITMLEEQLAKRREEVEGVRRMREKIEGVLAGLANQGVDGVGDAAAEAREKGAAVGGVEAEGERRKREQRAVMKALDDELMAD